MPNYDPNKPEPYWTVSRMSACYWIIKDYERPRTAPKWYVRRADDDRVSKRYYSRASGAFLALSEGAIVWED